MNSHLISCHLFDLIEWCIQEVTGCLNSCIKLCQQSICALHKNYSKIQKSFFLSLTASSGQKRSPVHYLFKYCMSLIFISVFPIADSSGADALDTQFFQVKKILFLQLPHLSIVFPLWCHKGTQKPEHFLSMHLFKSGATQRGNHKFFNTSWSLIHNVPNKLLTWCDSESKTLVFCGIWGKVYAWPINCGGAVGWPGCAGGRCSEIGLGVRACGCQPTCESWTSERMKGPWRWVCVCAHRGGHAWFMLMGMLSRRYMPPCAPPPPPGSRGAGMCRRLTCLFYFPRCLTCGWLIAFTALTQPGAWLSHRPPPGVCACLCVCIYVCVCAPDGCLTPPLISTTPLCLFSQPEPRPQHQRHSAQGGTFHLSSYTRAHIWPPALEHETDNKHVDAVTRNICSAAVVAEPFKYKKRGLLKVFQEEPLGLLRPRVFFWANPKASLIHLYLVECSRTLSSPLRNPGTARALTSRFHRESRRRLACGGSALFMSATRIEHLNNRLSR